MFRCCGTDCFCQFVTFRRNVLEGRMREPSQRSLLVCLILVTCVLFSAGWPHMFESLAPPKNSRWLGNVQTKMVNPMPVLVNGPRYAIASKRICSMEMENLCVSHCCILRHPFMYICFVYLRLLYNAVSCCIMRHSFMDLCSMYLCSLHYETSLPLSVDLFAFSSPLFLVLSG